MDLEARPGLSLVSATTHINYHWDLIYKYSSLVKLLRVTSILFRVLRRLREVPDSSLATPLTPDDLQQAKIFWVNATQAPYFAHEIRHLTKFALSSPTHPFTRLTAFIDHEFVIRVGGRLKNALLNDEDKHPIILPRHSHLSSLIIADAHHRTLHGGFQLMLSHIRRHYCIIEGRSPAKVHVLRCIRCARQRSWQFNPPAAPHMGGKWEVVLKSIKFHLRRTIGELTLTLEEFAALLAQIEAILNARPLETLSDDSDDVSALTPGNFLMGSALTALPEPSLQDVSLNRLSRWQLVQQRTLSFWTKWSSSYLQRQLAIAKWYPPTKRIQVGSLVLISDGRLPPCKWPLARVISIHPGNDGLTRMVTLKTATTTLTRPITKLALLPGQSPEDPSPPGSSS